MVLVPRLTISFQDRLMKFTQNWIWCGRRSGHSCHNLAPSPRVRSRHIYWPHPALMNRASSSDQEYGWVDSQWNVSESVDIDMLDIDKLQE